MSNSTRSFTENPHVRPATEQWLTQNGYTFKSEVKMPISGRADYIAYHLDGHCLIVECKSSSDSIGRSVRQILDYQRQYNKKAKLALAIPSEKISESIRMYCNKRNIQLISLDVPVDDYQGYDAHVAVSEQAVLALLAKKQEWGDLEPEIHNLIASINCQASMKYVLDYTTRSEMACAIVRKWGISDKTLQLELEIELIKFLGLGSSLDIGEYMKNDFLDDLTYQQK